AGVVMMSLTSALAAAAWQSAMGAGQPVETFRGWLASNFAGGLLVAPAVVAWFGDGAGDEEGESAGRMVSGALAFIVFVAGVLLVFADDPAQRQDDVLTFLPLLALALVALLLGIRPAMLAALTGACIAAATTERGWGPFAADGSWLGNPVL